MRTTKAKMPQKLRALAFLGRPHSAFLPIGGRKRELLQGQPMYFVPGHL